MMVRFSTEEIFMRFSAFAALALGVTAMAAVQTANWSYQGKTGSLNWGKLDPAYQTCAKGHEQSPIDIRGAHLNKALQPIDFHYIAGSIKLENDGHTIVAHVNPGSYIVANGVRYELVEFSFRHPSETAVKGKLTELEVQLLHRSADGKLAIVAVRLRENMDAPNAVLAAPAQDRWRNGKGDRDGQCRRTAARRPRLLDLLGLADHAALRRGRALVRP
jgi:carbonic anhydrase